MYPDLILSVRQGYWTASDKLGQNILSSFGQARTGSGKGSGKSSGKQYAYNPDEPFRGSVSHLYTLWYVNIPPDRRKSLRTA